MTAYDYRRCILLVQTLALDTEQAETLADSWGVPYEGLSVLSSRYQAHRELVRRLAQHALNHAHQEVK